MKKQRAFTLVELMITVAVIAVGLTFAVPAFTNFIRNNQMISQSNDFLVSLTFARSEALKRGRPTAVCATDDPAATPPSCSGNGAGWENGWLVFVDDDTAGTDGDYDNATEALLRVHAGLDASSLDGDGGNDFVRFDGEGLALQAENFTLTPAGCASGEPYQRSIDMTATGRASISTETC